MGKRLVLAFVLAASSAAAPPALAGDGEEPGRKPEAPAGKDAGKPAPPSAPAAAPSRTPRTKREALRILEHVVVSVNYEETPVRDFVAHLTVLSGVNVILGPALLREGEPDALKVTLRLRKVTARQVLEMAAESLGLGIGFQGGVLTLTTLQDARGKPVLRLYLVSDITFPLRDFPGPDLMLRPAGSEWTPPEETETKPAFPDADDILRMVKDHTGTGTWEDEGVSASAMRDWLVVRQYEEVHAEIARLLALLRAAR